MRVFLPYTALNQNTVYRTKSVCTKGLEHFSQVKTQEMISGALNVGCTMCESTSDQLMTSFNYQHGLSAIS